MRHLAANISSPKVRELHDHFPWREQAQFAQYKRAHVIFLQRTMDHRTYLNNNDHIQACKVTMPRKSQAKKLSTYIPMAVALGSETFVTCS